MLSDYDVLGEHSLVLPLGSFGRDVLDLADQGGSLLVNHRVNVHLYFVVAARHLSNDEVQEDKRGEDDHNKPCDPEENVLLCQFLVFNHGEVEVAQGESERREQVASKVTNPCILGCLVPRNDVESHGEHDNENEEEDQEDLKVEDDINDHGDDVTEVCEDLHEYERLDQASQNDDDHQNLRPNVPRSIHTHLERNVQVPDENVH